MINRLIFLVLVIPGLIWAHDYKVVGYYPNWAMYRTPSFKPHQVDATLLTHINYAFAKVDTDGKIHLIDSWADTDYRSDWNSEKPYYGNFFELAELKKQHPHLKTLISLGGWTLSDTFSQLASNPKARATFAKECVAFCKKYDFDGIDIDWEYPGFAEHSGRSEDKENFTLLLAELHKALKTNSPSLLLTIAAPAGPWHYKNIEVGLIHTYLDWINLMTYDLHGPWNDADNSVTNHQAALFSPDCGNPDLCTASAVHYYLANGVPAHKLVVGMPLYGRVFAQAATLFGPYKGPGEGTTQERGVRFFADIKKNLLAKTHRFWDDKAQVPYLIDPHTHEFITYDDEESLRLKSRFIKEMGLGGAMVWELGLDVHPTWDALRAIHDGLEE